jgi:hypothetical protein
MPNIIMPDSLVGTIIKQIARWRWLRPQEMAKLLMPENKHGRRQCDRACRELVAAGMLLPRELPKRAGMAYLLASRGVNWISTHYDQSFPAGKDWGRHIDGVWHPPESWLHDLAATTALIWLHGQGFQVWGEYALRRQQHIAEKHRDGIAKGPDGRVYWVEVETTDKGGKNLHKLIVALARAAKGVPVTTYPGIPDATAAMVVVDADQTDRDGHQINHLHRICSKAEKMKFEKHRRLEILWMVRSHTGAVADATLSHCYIGPPGGVPLDVE